MEKYRVVTELATFVLDETGVCTRASATSPRAPIGKCIGAQYVACLDSDVAASMLPMPRIGAVMLLAAVHEGRISLLRVGTILQFSSYEASPVREMPSRDAQPKRPAINFSKEPEKTTIFVRKTA